MRKRVLLIGRHDFWPGYTPAVIDEMDVDLWEQLAVQLDEELADRAERARERESEARRAAHARRGGR